MPFKKQKKETFSYVNRDILICLFLIIAILATYWQVKSHDFINFDDDIYITNNSYVQDGLTAKSISWAFITDHAGYWIPLTWLSHMLDCHFFGMNSGAHHMVNVFYHILNVLLLFLILKRMTGTFWRPCFVAALFALHPIHIESVAWAAERKDVLSAFFWMLTILSYIAFVKHQNMIRYFIVLLFFASGIMAKPMVVSLPFVLILLDFWPLERFQTSTICEDGSDKKKFCILQSAIEKIPLLIFSLASSVITINLQHKVGSITSLINLSLNERIANAVLSYSKYLGKLIWPFDLAILYPYPSDVNWVAVTGAGILIISISAIVVKLGKRKPYLVVGWLWYIGTLVPVSGIAQSGLQAMADRFAYIPFIGIYIMIAWSIPEIFEKLHIKRRQYLIPSILFLLPIIFITQKQLNYWTGSIPLFEHTLRVTQNNYVIHTNLGVVLENHGRVDEAISHYKKSLEINPLDSNTHVNLGTAFFSQGEMSEAINHYQKAIQIDTENPLAHNNLGLALVCTGNIEAAIGHFQEAVGYKSNFSDAHNNLIIARDISKKIKYATKNMDKALDINPKDLSLNSAIEHIDKVKKELNGAVAQYQKAILTQTTRSCVNVFNWAIVNDVWVKYEKALPLFREIIALHPENAAVHYNIACIYAIKNMKSEAIDWLMIAVGKGYENWELIKIDMTLYNIRNTSNYKKIIKHQ